jgi:flavin reductase (DIM6/NTAB) family NADH-FMN oxidoreductase RutF
MGKCPAGRQRGLLDITISTLLINVDHDIRRTMDIVNRPTSFPPIAPVQDFVNAMASAAMGVSIVTTHGVTGRFGLTVSAWSSVSAEPPLLLACINRKNRIADAITHNGFFAVNALDDSHADMARAFAGKPKSGEAYAFDEAQWQNANHSLPLLIGASATFICALDSFHDAGTHRIFMGRVEEAVPGTMSPLLYHNRTFGRFEPLE